LTGGDAALVTDTTRSILHDDPGDFLRATAADALKAVAGQKGEPDLLRALEDPGVRRVASTAAAAPPTARYIVRDAAAMALARLGHEVVRDSTGQWVVDPPLVVGVAVPDLIARIGAQGDGQPAGKWGVVVFLDTEPAHTLSVAVYPTAAAARAVWAEWRFGIPVPGDYLVSGLGESAGWWGPTRLAWIRRNVLCTVTAATQQDALDWGSKVDAALQLPGGPASMGSQVPVPSLVVDVPSTAQPGEYVTVKWRVTQGADILVAPLHGARSLSREGSCGLPTGRGPGRYSHDFWLVTANCVVLRQLVEVEVTPRE
jgi:hypothetical protein